MREHNIQNIAHLSYYTNANGLLLVVLKKRGSANISLGAVARACLSIEEVVDVLVELGVDGRDVAAARADRLIRVARRRDRGELGRGEVDVAQRWADALARRPAREVGGAAQRQRVVDAGTA